MIGFTGILFVVHGTIEKEKKTLQDGKVGNR